MPSSACRCSRHRAAVASVPCCSNVPPWMRATRALPPMFIHALSENTAMLRIARNAGAVIERTGSDAEAFLRLPPASLGSRMTEIVEDHYAQIDYRLKAQSKQSARHSCRHQDARIAAGAVTGGSPAPDSAFAVDSGHVGHERFPGDTPIRYPRGSPTSVPRQCPNPILSVPFQSGKTNARSCRNSLSSSIRALTRPRS